jgi:hypothetical protein
MFKKSLIGGICLLLSIFLFSHPGFSQEDKVVYAAINMLNAQIQLPSIVGIKFLEKEQSPIPGFYAVKLSLSTPVNKVPIMVYVDKAGEKVILEGLYVNGENASSDENVKLCHLNSTALALPQEILAIGH